MGDHADISTYLGRSLVVPFDAWIRDAGPGPVDGMRFGVWTFGRRHRKPRCGSPAGRSSNDSPNRVIRGHGPFSLAIDQRCVSNRCHRVETIRSLYHAIDGLSDPAEVEHHETSDPGPGRQQTRDRRTGDWSYSGPWHRGAGAACEGFTQSGPDVSVHLPERHLRRRHGDLPVGRGMRLHDPRRMRM